MNTKNAYQKYDGSLEQLAYDIGNAQYCTTAKVIGKVANKLSQKSLNSNSVKLTEIVNDFYEAKFAMDGAWRICKNKMEGECSKHPLNIVRYAGSIDELAQYIVDLDKYDFKRFTNLLGKDLLRQSNADFENNKIRLAAYLRLASSCLLRSSNL
jgi:hypothetical protein